MTEHLLLILSIFANTLAYAGCIGQRKGNCKVWKILTICGRILGVTGLFLILIYLSI